MLQNLPEIQKQRSEMKRWSWKGVCHQPLRILNQLYKKRTKLFKKHYILFALKCHKFVIYRSEIYGSSSSVPDAVS